jgi:hypothetical protein
MTVTQRSDPDLRSSDRPPTGWSDEVRDRVHDRVQLPCRIKPQSDKAAPLRGTASGAPRAGPDTLRPGPGAPGPVGRDCPD